MYLLRLLKNICANYRNALVSKKIIIDALNKPKYGKKDGDIGLISNHVLYASDSLVDKLSCFFSATFMHDHQPNVILRSSMASIPKDKKGNLCTDANYRGIALTSSIAKLIAAEKHRLPYDFRFAICV